MECPLPPTDERHGPRFRPTFQAASAPESNRRQIPQILAKRMLRICCTQTSGNEGAKRRASVSLLTCRRGLYWMQGSKLPLRWCSTGTMGNEGQTWITLVVNKAVRKCKGGESYCGKGLNGRERQQKRLRGGGTSEYFCGCKAFLA